MKPQALILAVRCVTVAMLPAAAAPLAGPSTRAARPTARSTTFVPRWQPGTLATFLTALSLPLLIWLLQTLIARLIGL